MMAQLKIPHIAMAADGGLSRARHRDRPHTVYGYRNMGRYPYHLGFFGPYVWDRYDTVEPV